MLHTPGHTPGSVCLYSAAQDLIFTGDTLLADGHYFRRPVPFPGTNFRDYRSSVERLAHLSFDAAFVGHGKPLRQGGSAALEEMMNSYFWLAPRWKGLLRRARSSLGR